MGDNRYTLRRSNPYHTLRNRAVPVRTPGNRLVAQYITKRAKGMICAETGKPLAGIRHLTTNKLRRMKKHERTVSRPYGGVFCGEVVKERIITAFMEEEARAAQEKKEQAEKRAAQEAKKRK
ncbi:ribosomal protein L34e [Tritrichomonas foetus]|uniref:Ribosomal protein L34e n=2 Tax=Tritrichomonas foetus TaxID=1144522 RepID=A0A1J4J8J8_9EUKA|nr:ribosomal protein L34e [Tritrichomonas foetus]|eukprot:OHS95514.1 ribosomal protein L34e [Tritrichomonas foetus]